MGGCLSSKVDNNYMMERLERGTHFEVSLFGAPNLTPQHSSTMVMQVPSEHLARTSSNLDLSGRTSFDHSGSIAGRHSDRRNSSALLAPAQAPPAAMKRRGTSNSTLIPQGSEKASKSNALNIKVNSEHTWLLKDAHIPPALTENIQDVRVLGKGLMGTVRLVKWTYMDKELFFAMKAVNKEYILKHNDVRHVNNERDILRVLSSPFVIRLFGTYQDDENIYYMLEYSAGGELFNRLVRKQSFPGEVAKFYASEIFLALEHVQSQGFVYRDLKPENVMLDANGHCKLVDFGFSRAPNKHGQCSTNCGTPAYLSPEQLNGKFTNGYTKVVDWWSFGCLIFELMTGLTPFCKKFSDSAYEIYMRVLKGSISFPSSFDKNTKDLIGDLLKHDLQQRLVDPLGIKNSAYFNFPHCSWADVESRQVRPPFVPKIKDIGDCYYFDDAPRDRNPRKPFKRNQSANCTNYFQGF